MSPNEGCAVADADRDGSPEIVVHCWVTKEPFVVWKIERPPGGKPAARTERLIDRSWSQAHSLARADLDGDGAGELSALSAARPGADPGPARGYAGADRGPTRGYAGADRGPSRGYPGPTGDDRGRPGADRGRTRG